MASAGATKEQIRAMAADDKGTADVLAAIDTKEKHVTQILQAIRKVNN